MLHVFLNVFLLMLLVPLTSSALRADDFDREPIHYSTSPSTDCISKLQQAVDKSVSTLKYDRSLGYLPDVLEELKVSTKSQMLVFSKTSLQRQRIAPQTPRAIYFNDNVYVGYCQDGEVLEFSAVDPQLGMVFYTLDQQESSQPKFRRQTDSCLLCHGSSQTHSVPGNLVRSVYPDAGGFPILSSGSFRIDHTSPIEKRWGGWYVTGMHGSQKHLGNLIIRDKQEPEQIDNSSGQNLTDLSRLVDLSSYPSSHSDIVALMVLEHQAKGHNLLTQANFVTRQALHYERNLNRELNESPDHRWASTTSRIRSVGEPLVEYLLFSSEAPLTSPIQGTSGFSEAFSQMGPRDSRNRSLRDFDLQTRLFKYPCSYLVYSDSFRLLPHEVKQYVRNRFQEILTGKDQSKSFSHLSPPDRENILEILKATMPEEWK